MARVRSVGRAALVAGALSAAMAAGGEAAVPCTGQPRIHEAQRPADVRAWFQARKAKVVTFFGYSGLGYENEPAMLERARATLARFDPATTIVNAGATVAGIGAVYRVAKDLGFATTGIVSSEARRAHAVLSPCVDVVFFVTDSAWGGFTDEARTQLSPTSQAMVENSDVLVAIGGGDVAHDELSAALSRGKASGRDVLYFAAEMNHANARARATQRGQPPPTTFDGPVAALFSSTDKR